MPVKKKRKGGGKHGPGKGGQPEPRARVGAGGTAMRGDAAGAGGARARAARDGAQREGDPRGLALSVLCGVEDGGYADALLGNALDASSLRGSDRDLATILVYGALARQLTLDHTLAAYCDRPLASMDTSLRVLLRLGLFQLAFLDRVPDYAAVDTTVGVARRVAPKLAGFVNAVLRRCAREGCLPLPSAGEDEHERLSVEYSHPAWLVDLWLRELGHEEAVALMAANNEAMPSVYRALCDRDRLLELLGERGIEARATCFAPDGIVAKHLPGLAGAAARGDDCGGGPGAPEGRPAEAEAGAACAASTLEAAVAQGEASQLVVRYLAPAPGETVLDACAAPGGKTAYIAKLVGGDGRVVAVDSAPGAAERIHRSLAVAGAGNVEVHECSIAAYAAEHERAQFDAVLVDAPCSGLGTLREHPEIRWRRSPEDLRDLSARQLAILQAAAGLLKPGGRLVYSTCTIADCENDAVVSGFLATRADFREDPTPSFESGGSPGGDCGFHPCAGKREDSGVGGAAPAGLGQTHDGDATPPGSRRPVLDELLDERGRLRTFPHRHDMDGFFAARLRRLA